MSSSIRRGIYAGALMSILLFLMSALTQGDINFQWYLKYTVLAGFVISAVASLSKAPGFLPVQAIRRGFTIASVSAVFVAVFNAVLYIVHPDWGFTKWGLHAESLPEILMISFALIVEVIAIGMILTLIAFQMFKTSEKP